MRSRLLPLAVVGMLVVYLAVAIPRRLIATARSLYAARELAGIPAAKLRQSVFGGSYTAAVEGIRSAVPVDEPYLLTFRDELGAMLWVRYDLLPRRAMVIGPATDRGDCWLRQLRWMVVGVGGGRPPLLRKLSGAVPPGCPPAPWLRGLRGLRALRALRVTSSASAPGPAGPPA
jgi:hypothetical protein